MSKSILGLCCMVDQLRKTKIEKNGKLVNTEIFCSRTMRLANFTVEKAKEKALQNLDDLLTLLDYCRIHKIKCFRISSDLFPLILDDNYQPKYSLDFAKDKLIKIGEFAKSHGIYLLVHPCQLVNLASPNLQVFELSKAILLHHLNFLEMMGTDSTSVMIIHLGGSYGDKKETKKVWVQRFAELPKSVSERIVIENCERQYNIRDCLDIHYQTGVSVVFDTHHYECYNLIHPGEFKETPDQFLPEVVKTWESRIPVFHISNQRENSKIGAHSDYIENVPDYLLEFLKTYVIRLEVEAKKKELAIFKLREKYSHIFE